MHTMCFDQIHPHFLLSNTSPTPPQHFPYQIHVLFYLFLLSPPSPLGAACMCMDMGPAAGSAFQAY